MNTLPNLGLLSPLPPPNEILFECWPLTTVLEDVFFFCWVIHFLRTVWKTMKSKQKNVKDEKQIDSGNYTQSYLCFCIIKKDVFHLTGMKSFWSHRIGRSSLAVSLVHTFLAILFLKMSIFSTNKQTYLWGKKICDFFSLHHD